MQNVVNVKVTNHNKFLIEDRYDGILYSFEPKKTCSVPYDAACHIFGVDFAPGPTGHLDPSLRDKAFRHLQRRWGWNRSAKLEEAKDAFEKLEFSIVHMTMVEKPVEEEEVALPEPHEIPTRGGRKYKEA